MNWRTILRRPELVGGYLEMAVDHDTQGLGPIIAVEFSAIALFPDRVILDWLAAASPGGPWRAFDLTTSIPFSGSAGSVTAIDNGIECTITPQHIIRFHFKGYTPPAVEGLAKMLDRSQWDYPRIELSETEWIALCGTRDPRPDEPDEAFSALPICCGNVSAVREELQVARDRDGFLLPANRKGLLATYKFLLGSHSPDEWDWTTLNKAMEQVEVGCVAALSAET